MRFLFKILLIDFFSHALPKLKFTFVYVFAYINKRDFFSKSFQLIFSCLFFFILFLFLLIKFSIALNSFLPPFKSFSYNRELVSVGRANQKRSSFKRHSHRKAQLGHISVPLDAQEIQFMYRYTERSLFPGLSDRGAVRLPCRLALDSSASFLPELLGGTFLFARTLRGSTSIALSRSWQTFGSCTVVSNPRMNF